MGNFIEDYHGLIRIPTPGYGVDRRGGPDPGGAALGGRAQGPQEISGLGHGLGPAAGALGQWADVMAKQEETKQKAEVLEWTSAFQDSEREADAQMAELKGKEGAEQAVAFKAGFYKTEIPKLLARARGDFQKSYLDSFAAHSRDAGLNRAFAHQVRELESYKDQVWQGETARTAALIDADPKNWERYVNQLNLLDDFMHPGEAQGFRDAKARGRRDQGLETAIMALGRSGDFDGAEGLFFKAFGRDGSGTGEAQGKTAGPALALPLAGSPRISSPFGHRVAPLPGASTDHQGIDYAVPVGTPVQASGNGTVVAVTSSHLGGKTVTIDHGNGLTTSYAHLDDFSGLQVGQQVWQGQIIAKSGDTGNSTGPHLHFSVRQDGQAVDPERALGGLSLDKGEILWGKLQDMKAARIKADHQEASDIIERTALEGTLTYEVMDKLAPYLSRADRTYGLQVVAGEAGYLADKQKYQRLEATRTIQANVELGYLPPTRTAITQFIVDNGLVPLFRMEDIRGLADFAEKETGKMNKVIDNFVALNKKDFGAKKENQDDNIAIFKIAALDAALQLGLTAADEDGLSAMLKHLAENKKYLQDNPVMSLGPTFTQGRPEKRHQIAADSIARSNLPLTPSNFWRANKAIEERKPLAEIMPQSAGNWTGRGALTLKGRSGFLKANGEIFEDAAKSHNIDPDYLAAIAMAASWGDQRYAGPQGVGRLAPGAVGLMQLPRATAEKMEDPFDIRANVFMAADLMTKLLTEHEGDPARAAAAYAALQGAKNPDKFGAEVVGLLEGRMPWQQSAFDHLGAGLGTMGGQLGRGVKAAAGHVGTGMQGTFGLLGERMVSGQLSRGTEPLAEAIFGPVEKEN
jgi:murein DD-endopeptidase MepM/ murein hydrolase activator NlpD